MNPYTEFRDLLTRSRRLVDAALLLILTFALLAVAVGTLFCVLVSTPARALRLTSDELIAKYDPKKAEAFHVL